MSELKIEHWLGENEKNNQHWLKVKSMIIPGKKLKIFYNKGNFSNRTIHIRGIIDDHYIVIKSWNNHKKMWRYSIETEYYFFLLVKDNFIKQVK